MLNLRLTRFVDVHLGRPTTFRIGLLVLRTHRSHIPWTPAGYRSPQTTWAVEWPEDDERPRAQLRVSTSEKVAGACMRQLEGEGREDLVVNVMNVHSRLQDWEWSR